MTSPTPPYRWNVSDYAAGYDAAAEQIHPHYTEMQAVLLDLLPFPADADFLLVDAGGGSGRLAERFLRRFRRARVAVLDQSEPFLAIAERRLAPFGARATCHRVRLQDDWSAVPPGRPDAILSMSAVHHLDRDEKRVLYRRCGDALAGGGVLINGDEVRPADDTAYLAECQAWAAHMHRLIDAGLVTPAMCHALLQWEQRNVRQFGTPRVSGDDCHETVDEQLACLARCGFARVDVPWQKGLWAVLRGVKG